MKKKETIKIFPEYNPVDFWNHYYHEDTMRLIAKKAKSVTGGDFTWYDGEERIGFKNGRLDLESDIELKNGKISAEVSWTPFMILTMLNFGGKKMSAYTWVDMKYLGATNKYIRVGTTYFKKSTHTDRFGVERNRLLRWSKQEIIDDHNKRFALDIPKLDGFTMHPSNTNYQSIVGKDYNLYQPFDHLPKKGEWKWTERLMRHVFGEQYGLGMIYMKVLYEHPTQTLPILVLSSQERMTGKSTFVNWLNQIFGKNATNVTPQDIENSFNGTYANSNIISIEETSSDKKHLVEKLKDLATKKLLSVNQKYIDQYDVEFYGKFVITTNDTDKFLIVDSLEVRFWVRVLTIPQFHNAKIEEDLVKEIPAFLAHLLSLPAVDFTKSRMVFTPAEIRTEQLAIVQENSKTWMYSEIVSLFEEFFNDHQGLEVVHVSVKDILDRWFTHDHNVNMKFLRKVMKDELLLLPEEPMRYLPFGVSEGVQGTKLGRPYAIERGGLMRLAEKL
jgi:hypothetical protein